MQDQDLDDPQSGIVAGLVGAIVIAAGGIAVALGARVLNDANDALVNAALVAEANDRKALRPEEVLPLTHPICVATMQTSVGVVVDHRGCYVAKVVR